MVSCAAGASAGPASSDSSSTSAPGMRGSGRRVGPGTPAPGAAARGEHEDEDGRRSSHRSRSRGRWGAPLLPPPLLCATLHQHHRPARRLHHRVQANRHPDRVLPCVHTRCRQGQSSTGGMACVGDSAGGERRDK
jgi:hypothetical protein